MTDKLETQLNQSLHKLKDFQLETVHRVMSHFSDKSHSGRVLVADEVGLGKTVVAKGVIAEMLKSRLNASDFKRLRVTYICSNLTLADENIRKLAVFEGDENKNYVLKPSFGRLTELAVKPVENDPNGEKLLEVCALTPSTSFTLTRGDGSHVERFIMWKLLSRHPALTGYKKPLSKLLRGNCSERTWDSNDDWFSEGRELDKDVLKAFYQKLESKPEYQEETWQGYEHCSWIKALVDICADNIACSNKSAFRSQLRRLLAQCCVKNLKSDLFILDEFQRFNSLLDTKEDNELNVIARGIFSNTSDAKLLLLSATPFKAMSRVEDEEVQTAHVDELRHLLNFLSKEDSEFLSQYEADRERLHSQVISLRNPSQRPENLIATYKNNIEAALSRFICRTERAQIVEQSDAIVSFKKGSEQAQACLAKFHHDEILAFKELDQIAEELKKLNRKTHASYLLEYQKSAPWTLSFMSGYQFKKHIDESLKGNRALAKSIRASKMSWLSRKEIQSYTLDLTRQGSNARLKAVMDSFFGDNGEELLWVPPTNPYYPLEGSFKDQQGFSKSLLFSSWALVPRALSGLISYEAERRLLLGRKGLHKEYYKEKEYVPKIVFNARNRVGWSYLYPCRTLANISLFTGAKSLKALIKDLSKQIKPLLAGFKPYANGKFSKTNWYALAPILLDKLHGFEHDVEDWRGAVRQHFSDGHHSTRLESLNSLFDLIENANLGPMPDDLAVWLAELSVGGPAICLQRAIADQSAVISAFKITECAMSFVSLFNKPESEKAVTRRYSKDYWRTIVRYCADGNVQSVIDEYFHLLLGSGLSYQEALDKLSHVLNTNTVTVGCHFREEIEKKKGEGSSGERLRCHYAVPLGNQKMTDEKGVERVSNVRDAFNSPFKPFVLNSTSIGQEGLDFHWYCSRIVHWNLPSNPIDLEQREGRVNRYKSLVVRRRLVEMFTQQVTPEHRYCWDKLFAYAEQQTRQHRKSDLEPYWHLSSGSAKIERIVPLMPMSKDLIKLNQSLKVLSLYRLAFGQPRQEELLDNLLERNFSDEEIAVIMDKLVINLSPLVHTKRARTFRATD